MTGLKNHLYKQLCLLLVFFFFVSCGGMNDSKPTAENKEKTTADQIQISKLESELIIVRQDQETLKVQMQDKNTIIQELQENISTLENKISSIEKKAAAMKPAAHKIEYATPFDLYKKARNLLIEEEYIAAATLFTEFIKNHPQDSLADNAAYWRGECHYSLGEYKQAILLFKDLVTTYPKSEKVPGAILKTGYSYLSLDDSNRAHHYLKQVLKKYPFSPAAEKAQEKLRSFE